MRKAFVLGGTGFVGRHVARRLADAGWEVTVAARGETPIPAGLKDLRLATVDRAVPGALESVTSEGFDVLIDVVPYEPEDAKQLLKLSGQFGSIVAISTTSVYADDVGRTLDETTGAEDSPRMPVPILETQRRTVASEATYSTKKVAIEDILLSQETVPVTAIRPCAIYGPGDLQCREWFFVKRVLDQRRVVVLGNMGESVFHTTSVHNLAEMIRLAAANPVHGAFNCADPDAPSVRAIARTISDVMDHDWDEVLLSPNISGEIAGNPWMTFHPWIASTEKARDELSYEPVMDYQEAIVETVGWIVDAVRDRDWREVLPKAAEYLGNKFNYEAEDELIRSL
jgi:nucleoside-diphosphate-sugar epimerase